MHCHSMLSVFFFLSKGCCDTNGTSFRKKGRELFMECGVSFFLFIGLGREYLFRILQ